MPRALFVAIFEIGTLGGCVAAAFLVPPATPFRTFLTICAGAILLGNVMLIRSLRKPVDPKRKVDNTKLYVGATLRLLALIMQFVWK